MTAALAITKRELRSAFNSPVAYIVVTAFMLLVGWWVRTKAAQGIGTMNEEGATERIAKAQRDGNPL